MPPFKRGLIALEVKQTFRSLLCWGLDHFVSVTNASRTTSTGFSWRCAPGLFRPRRRKRGVVGAGCAVLFSVSLFTYWYRSRTTESYFQGVCVCVRDNWYALPPLPLPFPPSLISGCVFVSQHGAHRLIDSRVHLLLLPARWDAVQQSSQPKLPTASDRVPARSKQHHRWVHTPASTHSSVFLFSFLTFFAHFCSFADQEIVSAKHLLRLTRAHAYPDWKAAEGRANGTGCFAKPFWKYISRDVGQRQQKRLFWSRAAGKGVKNSSETGRGSGLLRKHQPHTGPGRLGRGFETHDCIDDHDTATVRTFWFELMKCNVRPAWLCPQYKYPQRTIRT